MPVTRAPRAAIASARMPPPQPTSSTFFPARLARSSIQPRRSGLISCSGRNSPSGSHQREASWLNFSSSAGSTFIRGSLSQKKAPPKRGLFRRRRRYWLELEDEEPPFVPLDPALPEPELAPVLAVLSRLPRSAASTRRSGCRHEISFWFLLLSAPRRWHWLPVTGSASPRPSTSRRLRSTPFSAR